MFLKGSAHRAKVVRTDDGILMGFLQDAKNKLTGGKSKAAGVVDDHGDKISDGVDKAADVVDDKTGGKFGDQIDQGADKAKDALDSLDGQDDDIK